MNWVWTSFFIFAFCAQKRFRDEDCPAGCERVPKLLKTDILNGVALDTVHDTGLFSMLDVPVISRIIAFGHLETAMLLSMTCKHIRHAAFRTAISFMVYEEYAIKVLGLQSNPTTLEELERATPLVLLALRNGWEAHAGGDFALLICRLFSRMEGPKSLCQLAQTVDSADLTASSKNMLITLLLRSLYQKDLALSKDFFRLLYEKRFTPPLGKVIFVLNQWPCLEFSEFRFEHQVCTVLQFNISRKGRPIILAKEDFIGISDGFQNTSANLGTFDDFLAFPKLYPVEAGRVIRNVLLARQFGRVAHRKLCPFDDQNLVAFLRDTLEVDARLPTADDVWNALAAGNPDYIYELLYLTVRLNAFAPFDAGVSFKHYGEIGIVHEAYTLICATARNEIVDQTGWSKFKRAVVKELSLLTRCPFKVRRIA